MLITETTIRTITLNDKDILQAIIMYTKARGENDIGEVNIELSPNASAIIKITKTTEPRQS